eukprot:m.22936 g.22936  ORF g.22936 m.22936 type:complete len:259 (+) comp8395_c0_seq1:1013-1789(+)
MVGISMASMAPTKRSSQGTAATIFGGAQCQVELQEKLEMSVPACDDYHSESDEDYAPTKAELEEESGDRKRAKKDDSSTPIKQEESEAERKARLDALFLAELGGPPPKPKPIAANISSTNIIKSLPASAAVAVAGSEKQGRAEPPKMVNITRTYQFAGADVQVQETVSDKTAARIAQKEKKPESALESILGSIGPKKAMTTLRKSQLDWDTYTTRTGIADELKRNHGQLDKHDFLQRVEERTHDTLVTLRTQARKPPV